MYLISTRFGNSGIAIATDPIFVPQMNAATLLLAILTNASMLEDLNRRFPVLGPRLFEISKSVEGGEDRVTYVWDRMVKFFLGNKTTINPDNQEGFLDVSGSDRMGYSYKPICAGYLVPYHKLKTRNYMERDFSFYRAKTNEMNTGNCKKMRRSNRHVRVKIK